MEGRKEGRKEGREGGRKEGGREGRKGGMKEGKKGGRKVKTCLEANVKCYIVPACVLGRTFFCSHDRNPVHTT